MENFDAQLDTGKNIMSVNQDIIDPFNFSVFKVSARSLGPMHSLNDEYP